MASSIITPYSRAFMDCLTVNATYDMFVSPQPGFVMMVQLTLDGISGTLTLAPSVSFGSAASSPNWNDIIQTTALTGLDTADEMWTLQLGNGTSVKTLGNSTVRMKVQVAATGATTYTVGAVIYFVEAPFGAGI